MSNQCSILQFICGTALLSDKKKIWHILSLTCTINLTLTNIVLYTWSPLPVCPLVPSLSQATITTTTRSTRSSSSPSRGRTRRRESRRMRSTQIGWWRRFSSMGWEPGKRRDSYFGQDITRSRHEDKCAVIFRLLTIYISEEYLQKLLTCLGLDDLLNYFKVGVTVKATT